MKVVNDIWVDKFRVVEVVRRRHLIAELMVDVTGVKTGMQHHPDTLERVFQIAANAGLVSDTIEVAKISRGQYDIGYMFYLQGRIANVGKEVVAQVLEVEDQTKIDQKELKSVDAKIKKMQAEIEKLKRDKVKLSPKYYSFRDNTIQADPHGKAMLSLKPIRSH